MTKLGKVQVAFRTKQNRQTLGDYYAVVIQQYRIARRAGQYYTKCALENCLVELGFAAEMLEINMAEIAREHNLLKGQHISCPAGC